MPFKTVFSFPERSLVTIVSMQTILIIRLTTGGFIGDNPACFKDLGVQRVEKGGASLATPPLDCAVSSENQSNLRGSILSVPPDHVPLSCTTTSHCLREAH